MASISLETKRVWNSLEIAKFIASLATPIAVAVVGFWISLKVREHDQRQKEAQDAEQKRFEEAQRKLYRDDEPHIELTLRCQFHGIRGEKRLISFVVSAANVGRVEHKFDKILLRVRGIKKDELFDYDSKGDPFPDEHAQRALFPTKLFERNLVPSTENTTWNYIFVEPGVKQDVSFTTVVPDEYSHLLAYVWFQYEATRPHTAEAVFAVPQAVTN